MGESRLVWTGDVSLGAWIAAFLGSFGGRWARWSPAASLPTPGGCTRCKIEAGDHRRGRRCARSPTAPSTH